MTLENFIHLPFRLKYEAFLRFWLNSPALKQEAIYRHMWEIEQLAFEHMRPGTVTGELFDMAEQAVEEAGLVYLWTGLGHSVGLRVHEGFEIAHGSDQVLQSGMVICIEPTCIEQDAKYHIEDIVLIRQDGLELPSDFMNTERMFVIR